METWTERSERVAVNLPADLLPLWTRIQDGIKGVDADDRATKFMEYVEAHPTEALDAVQRAADKKLEAMLSERDREVESYDVDDVVPF